MYELGDDLWGLPSNNPFRAFYNQSNNMLLIKRFAHYCDALQFSSPELERKSGYRTQLARFPQSDPGSASGASQKTKSIVTVGWGGSIGHLNDMAKISDRLVPWILSLQKVHLYLMCADPIWELFDAVPGNRKGRFATGSVADYYNFVSHLDIGLAPLKDTPFNRSRSDVKFLEYVPSTAQSQSVEATGPYLLSVKPGGTGFFFHSTDELISILDRLVSDAAARSKVSASPREYVLRERNYVDGGLDGGVLP